MLLGFTNTKISNNHKLLSHNNLFFLEGKLALLVFWNIEPQPQSPLTSEGDPAMVNQNQFLLLSFGEGGDKLWEI